MNAKKEFMELDYDKYVEMKAEIYTLNQKGLRLRESHDSLIDTLDMATGGLQALLAVAGRDQDDNELVKLIEERITKAKKL